MTRYAGRAWRLCATGFSFAIFGLGGLVLTLLVFPLLSLLPARRRIMTARRLIQRAFSLFIGMMELLGVLRLEVNDRNKLRTCRDVLVLANHPSLIDVVALISLMPQANCVIKQALLRNPFVGVVVRGAGYISNASASELLADCARGVQSGDPLIIFPEGTRTEPGKQLRFQRGASYVALQSKRPILPVLISCEPASLSKGDKWYKVPASRVVLRLTVLDSFDASTLIDPVQAPGIAARKLTHALENSFTTALVHHGYFPAPS
jgi:1-acyl-sn-glycerol-3-phosphate acyltransferase